jgi:hypothetical protein
LCPAVKPGGYDYLTQLRIANFNLLNDGILPERIPFGKTTTWEAQDVRPLTVATQEET